jgi:hypothetical protein
MTLQFYGILGMLAGVTVAMLFCGVMGLAGKYE